MRLRFPAAFSYDGEVWCGYCLRDWAPLMETPQPFTVDDEGEACAICGRELMAQRNGIIIDTDLR